MATYNATTTTAADVLSSAVSAEHFERTFIVPVSSATPTTLHLEPFVGTPHFVSHATPTHHHHQQTSSSSSSYTFVQIKREPCQVSEVTTSNNCNQQQQHHHHQQQHSITSTQQHHGLHGVGLNVGAASKTMSSSSSSTLTTLVKIEASSPKVPDMDKCVPPVATLAASNNSVPIGIAVARKRPQESNISMGNSTALPMQQQQLNKDMIGYGIRVADLGGVGNSCGNIYFTGNGDLMNGSTTAEELALSAASVQNVNRAQSTFWQYPNALPIESVISMSPATVGLQYSREANRGQVVLLPATAAALGISNFPLYTPTDPFQQAAAAFVWPSYMTQGNAGSAAAAAAALQPPPNFIFPSMSPHSTLQAQPYATSLQLFGSNYLTAAAAAAAAAAATSTLCHNHNQQQQQQTNSSSSSINLSLSSMGMGMGSSSSTTSTSTSSRYLSMAATPESHKQHKPMPLTLPPLQPQPPPLLLPPTAMKIEDWNATDYMAVQKTASVLPPFNYDSGLRDKNSSASTSNLLQLQTDSAAHTQALNLMRLPTPPTSATIETSQAQLQPQQLIFQTTTTTSSAPATPTLLNLSINGLPRAASATQACASITPNFITNNVSESGSTITAIGPPTPHIDEPPLNFKTSTLDLQSQIVVGVPRAVVGTPNAGPAPQMQDVNIQTDTPVCSDDENSSCHLAIQQQQQQQQHLTTVFETETLQPLELTKTSCVEAVKEATSEAHNECHNHNKEEATESEVLATENVVEQSISDDHLVPVSNNLDTEETQESVPEASLIPVLNEAVSAEDLTGLELLSNISTSTLLKSNSSTSATIRVKQEPLDHSDGAAIGFINNTQPSSLMLNAAHVSPQIEMHTLLPPSTVEPLGGLNLLCALAEQRIQEEVQSNGGLFAAPSSTNDCIEATTFTRSPFQSQTVTNYRLESAPVAEGSFPSMEGIELPSTSGACSSGVGEPVKRKKHKHSKSSKSNAAGGVVSKKSSQRCGKKNKKKYSKEKRKHKQAHLAQTPPPGPAIDELDFEDEQLQEELKSAFNCVDPNYKRFGGKWPNPQEIFSIMESNMRMRLADITRQYRKKKRKLDEISKNKKKKKCSKLAAAAAAALSLGVNGSSSGLNVASTSSPLCDYNFAKFSKSSASTSTSAATYLNSSSFMRFVDKPQTHAPFPPPDAGTLRDVADCSSAVVTYKPVRLEPSALNAVDNKGVISNSVSCSSSSALRLAQKHASSDKTTPSLVCKERKLLSTSRRRCSIVENTTMTAAQSSPPPPLRKTNPMDRELTLTGEHLYRKETRVLTDMGGLFYAGILKPLQPPDVYAITLDGERGNKSHIMSREEIFKDTILEVAPKSVESVPIGTRLCAYWSQQYRCLYPGRAIESESSDDGVTPNDFVSVEFDDGDSGRIRLQNIRLLLSDYPIVEYNDNPLYSLGKQKKTSVKSDNASDPQHQHDQSSSAAEDQQLSQTSSAHLPPVNNDTSELHQTVMERFAQRTEKKRIKSLKKKSLATAAAAAAEATAAAVTGGTAVESNDSNSRKHHKHKKRKKHKKHHHRKTNIDAESNTFNNNTANIAVAAAYVNKCEEEEPDAEQEPINEELDAAEEEEEAMVDVDEPQQAHVELNGVRRTAQCTASIKLEVVTPAGGVKVKTEHLDMEEETTSNLMSEVSDEVKGDDEVEHNNSKGSKIAAFLPERQLWGWLGKAYRKAGVKGRARKQFYKTIKRGKETITVGDCAVFLSTGRPDRPYIGRIESMWETASSNKVVRVRWFYHPEETTGCPNLEFPGALFESPHEDENDVQTISHRCGVLAFGRYFAKYGADSKQYQSIYDNNDTYYLAGFYNPRLLVLKLQDDIPTLEEEKTTTTTSTTTTDE